MVLTSDEARTIAERFLDENVRPRLDAEIVVTDVHEFPTCWLIGFNSRAYVETRSFSHMLVGGGPIIVNRRTGIARMGTSAQPPEDQLDPT
jgi:Immunity protein 35